jgi:hypothetical protein
MRRKLFNLAGLTSLLLLIAMCAIWAGSYARAYVGFVSKSVWPSDDLCVHRFLSVRLVLGHWVVWWGRYDYDLTVPGVARFHHAMDTPTFRKEYSAGIKSTVSTYVVKLGPQPPIILDDGSKVAINFTPDAYFLSVPLWHGFGRKDDPRNTYLGRTDVKHSAVVPAWPGAIALAVLPAVWLSQAARRRRRARTGRCLTCGYDLRATPDRCPECGQFKGAILN